MGYSDFTLAELRRRFGVELAYSPGLFDDAPESDPTPAVEYVLEHYMPFALNMNTEKARSELIVAPILMELTLSRPGPLALFSGSTFEVDAAAGLTGRCDYIIARSPRPFELQAPAIIVVEAKNENLIAGIPQCLAGMVAAQRLNARDAANGPVFGAVTTGTAWRFLRLDGANARIDDAEIPVQQIRKIFGIFDGCLRDGAARPRLEPVPPAPG